MTGVFPLISEALRFLLRMRYFLLAIFSALATSGCGEKGKTPDSTAASVSEDPRVTEAKAMLLQLVNENYLASNGDFFVEANLQDQPAGSGVSKGKVIIQAGKWTIHEHPLSTGMQLNEADRRNGLSYRLWISADAEAFRLYSEAPMKWGGSAKGDEHKGDLKLGWTEWYSNINLANACYQIKDGKWEVFIQGASPTFRRSGGTLDTAKFIFYTKGPAKDDRFRVEYSKPASLPPAN